MNTPKIDEIHQTALYRQYIRKLKWNVVELNDDALYLKTFPVIGSIAKLQRTKKLPQISKMIYVIKTHRVFELVVEPCTNVSQKTLTGWTARLKKMVRIRISNTPYIPTKTIVIDLNPVEDDIFSRFTSAKRRAVRKAIKHGVQVQNSSDIDLFIKLKSRAAGFLGSLTTAHLRPLWEIYSPKNAITVLAYQKPSMSPIAGILLLRQNRTMHYWIAGAIPLGKKLYAPTLLVWEALKYSKNSGCTKFDFVGVYDERLPKKYASWSGFTKFKEGFGGKNLYYPIAMHHRQV